MNTAVVFPGRAGKTSELMGCGRGRIGWPKTGDCGRFGNPYIPKASLLRFGLAPVRPLPLPW